MLARFSDGDAVMLGRIAREGNAVHSKNGCNNGSKNGAGQESQITKTHGD
jgi:hypothetical protein